MIEFYGLAAVVTALGVALWRLTSRFLRHIEKKDDSFMNFLGNHMSKNTEALIATADALNALSAEIHNREIHMTATPTEVKVDVSKSA